MYETDSFHTLSMAGQMGLLAVSLGYFISLAWVVQRLTRARSGIVRIAVWGLLFYLFIWASPQGYYAYYRLIFDGLPQQWVIGWPTSPFDALRILSFTGPQTLSAHSLGAMGWVLLALALWPQRSKCRNAAN